MATRLDQIKDDRVTKLEKIRALNINPYPSKIALEGERVLVSQAREGMGKVFVVPGRLMSLRGHGGLLFADLGDSTARIQLWMQKKKLEATFDLIKLLDVGDHIAVKGTIVTTKTGEVSVDVDELQLLGKSMRPLPSDWYGLSDTEERYRKRYLDLLMNEEVRKRFNMRTKMISGVRAYLDGLGFYEVETPTLQVQYGGANAKPFKTHLNALDIPMFLRIADELYLKRLVVGGYDRVYEICKDFRNEGVDLTHNPEFTMIEYYEAYADYHRVMDVTEGLFKHLANLLFGKHEMHVHEHTINVGEKWPRITMTDIVKEKLGIDVNEMSHEELLDYAKKEKIEVLGGETKGQLIFSIFDHRVTPFLVEPTWIIDYPEDVSPLSKPHPTKPGWVERFEGYIGGKEICDGWSELTDPKIQRERFEGDTKAVRKDREEAQKVDEDFIEAMEYGMPPIGGIGIGIDRLTMFFTNTWSIKEVILYPLMRPVDSEPKA